MVSGAMYSNGKNWERKMMAAQSYSLDLAVRRLVVILQELFM